MTLDAPLNERQVEVLHWISDGCPDGRWTDFTFKTTATAIASRRLIRVSKRGGIWSAALLPAGEYYLANSKYPPGHWAKRRSHHVDLDAAVQPTVAARQPVASPLKGGPERPKKPSPHEGLTPTRKLVKDIVAAGGILEIDTKDDDTSYRSLVGIINRRGMAPDGQEVLMMQGKSYHHALFRLSSVSDWQTESPSDIVAAERIGRWHPAVAKVRQDKRLDGIGKELRGRVFRLLHALAKEAEARGHSVRAPSRDRYGYYRQDGKLDGDLVIRVGDIECAVNIRQPKDRVDHIPTHEEIEREKRSGWGPHRYDYVPANRLSVTIETDSRFSSKQSWTETKTIPLELRLPDVMMTFERWAIIDADGKEAERRAAIEKREREARENALAREEYVEHALGERLVADANRWELSKKLRAYLAEMDDQIQQIADVDERQAAVDWFAWCTEYAAKQDPFVRPIRRPTVKEAGYSEIQEFRRRLGFHSGLW